MVWRDPRRVKPSYCWAVGANDRNLVGWSYSSLLALCGSPGTLASLSTALGLWEQCFDPGIVDEEEDSAKHGCEEEVDEETMRC